MAFRNQKIILALLQFAAFWSVWRWYYLRLSASSDEYYGILSLAAIGVLSFKFGNRETEISNFRLIVASLIIYILAFPFAPPLVAGIIAVTSLTFTVSGWRFGRKFHPGIWGLFLLSLPLIASMQFYLGFPLRLIVGEATAWLLKLNGLAVYREGVCLHFGEQLIWIDAPCSGIKMLWMGFFLASLLITIYRFRFFKSVAAFAVAFAVIITGNIFRAAGLFYLEAGLIKLPPAAHEAIGVAAFILTCAGIAAALNKIKQSSSLEQNSFAEKKRKSFRLNSWQTGAFIIAAVAACLVSFSDFEISSEKSLPITVDFPTEFENRPLQRLQLSAREEVFARDFPGEIRRYAQGGREIIIRYVTEPTRKLHPASDCFSAIGYKITPLPLRIDESRQKWSCFRATKEDENLRVCERIYTDNGESWTDVSSWYWSAMSRENAGYWALTVAESEQQNDYLRRLSGETNSSFEE